MPWGVILLFGGGFALASGSDSSGLSTWIGEQLESLESLDHRLILLILCLIACFLTQVASNVTTATIIVPIVLKLSQKLRINPIYLVMPPTLVCSFAFMLPVSTAPNAIAFGPSGLTTMEMARVGLAVTIICLGVSILCIETYGFQMFDLGTYPDWMPNSTARGNLVF
jgi:di/tricarboxylate transporter